MQTMRNEVLRQGEWSVSSGYDMLIASQACQASDMKKSHRNDCVALQQLSKWSKFNWDSYSQADFVLY
jgi:hypothetical protein